MAETYDVPARLRRHAKQVPDDIRKRLSAAELRARCEYAEQHYRTASDTGEAEHARYLTAHARKILRSLPVVEYLAELRRLREQHATADTSRVWGPLQRSISDTYRERVRELKDAHAYPPNMEAQVDNALLGKPASLLAQACIAAAR